MPADLLLNIGKEFRFNKICKKTNDNTLSKCLFGINDYLLKYVSNHDGWRQLGNVWDRDPACRRLSSEPGPEEQGPSDCQFGNGCSSLLVVLSDSVCNKNITITITCVF